MKVVIDTAIWSLVLRRREPDADVTAGLKALIEDQRAIILGPIRQEVLSGFSDKKQFDRLRGKLHFFDDEAILSQDYITAAEFSNACRMAGVQGSHTDYLICACAYRLGFSIYTTDIDFTEYERHLPITLHGPKDR